VAETKPIPQEIGGNSPSSAGLFGRDELSPTIAQLFESHRPLIDVCVEGLTVWLSSPRGTPLQKCIRIDYDSKDESVSFFPNALLVLGYLAPSFEVPGYTMRLEHDFLHSSVSLWIEPSNANPVSNVTS